MCYDNIRYVLVHAVNKRAFFWFKYLQKFYLLLFYIFNTSRRYKLGLTNSASWAVSGYIYTG